MTEARGMSFAKHSGRVVVTCFRPFTILLVLAGILKTEVDSSHDVASSISQGQALYVPLNF